MPTAKVTSKGQITIPIDVRRALGIDTGDTLVFEAQAEYVTVRRQETAHEYFSRLREKYPSGPARFADDDAAIADGYRNMTDEEIWGGDVLRACTFTRESVNAAIGGDREDR